MEKASRHDVRKQKKKAQKRKRAMTSAPVTMVSHNHDGSDAESVESEEGPARNKAAPTVNPAATNAPILEFLHGNQTRSPTDVLAWMIAPITVQQFLESVYYKLFAIILISAASTGKRNHF